MRSVLQKGGNTQDSQRFPCSIHTGNGEEEPVRQSVLTERTQENEQCYHDKEMNDLTLPYLKNRYFLWVNMSPLVDIIIISHNSTSLYS